MQTAIMLLLLCLLCACAKLETYPETPHVRFVSFTYVDTTDILGNRTLNGTLRFEFSDGDGDIGFDTMSNEKQNTIFMHKFRKDSGRFAEVDLPAAMEYYVPKITASTNNQSVVGEMAVKDLNEYYPVSHDTIFYTFFIVDRAGHQSNTDSTNIIIVE